MARRTYYNYCEKHGCNLDPGEKCELCEEERIRREGYSKLFWINPDTGQMVIWNTDKIVARRESMGG